MVTIASINVRPVNAGFFSDMNALLACPLQHASKYDTCAQIVNPLYVIQPVLAQDQVKRQCCSILALRDCTRLISSIICGSNSVNSLGGLLNGLKVISVQCAGIDSLTDCINPWFLFLLIVSFFWLLSSCIKCCCCPSRKKVTVQLNNRHSTQPLLAEGDIA